jgi:hypothetical protein
MSVERQQKSTRFSRWRERRRQKALRASEIGHRVKAERAKHDHSSHQRGGGDGGFSGGVGGI